MLGETLPLVVLVALMGIAAVLYASSGHGGATAYLALMGLFSVAPATMKPLALVLNVVVAGTGSLRLAKAGQVPWRALAFLLTGSVPLAFVGGRADLPSEVYRPLLGVILLAAAARLFLPMNERALRHPPAGILLVVMGAGMGLLSGLTGIGGGVFLSPLLVLMRWEDPRRTAGAASVFIVVNSVTGLVGLATRGGLHGLPPELPFVVVVVLLGGLLGSWLAVHKLAPTGLRRALGVVLVISGAKLIAEGLGVG